MHLVQIRTFAGREIVETNNILPQEQEVFDQVRADETSRARDEPATALCGDLACERHRIRAARRARRVRATFRRRPGTSRRRTARREAGAQAWCPPAAVCIACVPPRPRSPLPSAAC